MVGTITTLAFARGDTVVVGAWESGPLGPMRDVMWVRPDGHRVLLAPDTQTAAFVAAIYDFDEVVIAPVTLRVDGHEHDLRAGPLHLRYAVAPWRVPVPGSGRSWFVRWVQGPVARLLLGVRTHGTSPTGVREWYRAAHVRRVVHASASLDGSTLGPLARRPGPVRVGPSEPPPFVSEVRLSTVLEDPSAALDRLLAVLRSRRWTPAAGVGDGRHRDVLDAGSG